MDRIVLDVVIILHFLWLVFVITGWIYCARSRFWRWTHSATVVYGLLIEVFRFYCPLTHLENYYRRQLGWNAYEGDFITHYLEKIIYVNAPQWLLIVGALALVLVTGVRYWRVQSGSDS